MILRYFTRGDIVLIAGFLILALAGFAGVYQYGFGGKHVVVYVNGRSAMELPLDSDVTKSVTGPLGETVIVVENGTARIEHSPCPNHYCERMGKIKYRGEIAVCVPNRVVVSIKGGSDSESFDGVTQ